VVSQLDERNVAEVKHIINFPPQHDPYTTLKTELISRLCPTRDQRIRQLSTLKEIGDRKQSQFLRHLRSLAPDIPDNYLRILWTSRQPTKVQVILAGMLTGPNGVPSPAPVARRETRTADVSSGTRLQFRLRQPLHYRRQQASVPDRHRFRPLRVPAQTPPSAQFTSRLRPLRCKWHYHLHIWVAATQPQLGIAPGLHVAIRGGGRLATSHWNRFSRAFRPTS
jgi:hypothetical protein